MKATESEGEWQKVVGGRRDKMAACGPVLVAGEAAPEAMVWSMAKLAIAAERILMAAPVGAGDGSREQAPNRWRRRVVLGKCYECREGQDGGARGENNVRSAEREGGYEAC